MKPKVSIVCITYNHADYIEKAIEGFLMQKTNFPYEILIHDDASTDKTAEIIKKYEDKFPHIIKPIYQIENQYSKGVNMWADILIPLAKGQYIAICEGDDYWTDENKLQIQVDYMEQHKECSLTFHLADELSLIDNTIRKGAPFLWSTKCDINRFNKRRTIIETCTLVCRRKDLMDLPKYYYNSSVSDLPLELHLLTKGYGYYFHKNMATHLYMVPGSWSQRHSNRNLDSYISGMGERIKLYEEFDESTNKKYHEMVEAEISRYKYFIAIRKDDIKIAKKYRKMCRTNFKALVMDYIYLASPTFHSKALQFKKRLDTRRKAI